MRGARLTQGVFGRNYAAAYDDLYQDKDYVAECDLIENVFNLYGQPLVRRVLDLGCGTGGHAVLLAGRGYDVVGVDRSPEMLERARARGSAARFELGEIGNADVQAALATARRHLRPNGLFFADFWYGPAVLGERPSERVKVIDTPSG